MRDTVTVTIANKKGLHARAAAKFVNTVESFNAKVRVVKLTSSPELPNFDSGEVGVGGTSILGLMMLGADIGSQVVIAAEGEQSEQVLAALKTLIEDKFGEAE